MSPNTIHKQSEAMYSYIAPDDDSRRGLDLLLPPRFHHSSLDLSTMTGEWTHRCSFQLHEYKNVNNTTSDSAPCHCSMNGAELVSSSVPRSVTISNSLLVLTVVEVHSTTFFSSHQGEADLSMPGPTLWGVRRSWWHEYNHLSPPRHSHSPIEGCNNPIVDTTKGINAAAEKGEERLSVPSVFFATICTGKERGEGNQHTLLYQRLITVEIQRYSPSPPLFPMGKAKLVGINLRAPRSKFCVP